MPLEPSHASGYGLAAPGAGGRPTLAVHLDGPDLRAADYKREDAGRLAPSDPAEGSGSKPAL